MGMSPRLKAHRKFLGSLNDSVERPFLVPMETLFVGPLAGVPAPNVYNVLSGRELFIYGITGYVQIVPRAAPGTVEDPDVELPDAITLQLQISPSDLTLFSAPITLSQIISTYHRPRTLFKLPAVWRVPADSQITATWAARAMAAWVAQRIFGVMLICEMVRHDALTSAASEVQRLTAAEAARLKK